jgi:transposase
LFAGRRNRIYARVYALFEKVRGHYSFHFAAFRNYRDYSQSPVADLRDIAARLELVTENERTTFVDQPDRGELDEARRTANTLGRKRIPAPS